MKACWGCGNDRKKLRRDPFCTTACAGGFADVVAAVVKRSGAAHVEHDGEQLVVWNPGKKRREA